MSSIKNRELNNQKEDEMINAQISQMKESGVHFHYDRQSRIVKKMAHSNFEELQRRKKNRGRVLIIIVLISALMWGVQKHLKTPGKILGNNFVIELKMLHTSDESILKVRMRSIEGKVIIPAGTVIYFTFFHNKGDIYKEKIFFKNETILSRKRELLHALYFPRSIIFRALGYRVQCPSLGIDGKIKLR